MTQAANNSFQKHKYTLICKLSIYATVMFILKTHEMPKEHNNPKLVLLENHISPLLVLGSSLDKGFGFPIFSEPFHCNFSVSNGSK